MARRFVSQSSCQTGGMSDHYHNRESSEDVVNTTLEAEALTETCVRRKIVETHRTFRETDAQLMARGA
jgi:hypothetical protein